MKYKHSIPVEFEKRYSPEPNSGCWLWTGTYWKEYGVFSRHRHVSHAHRVSWELHRGPIPDGMCVLHKCDTPACVNPDHLFLGSNDANMQDMVSKRRAPLGERNYRAKLTEAEVIAIRSDPRSNVLIAADYAVNNRSVSHIKLRKTWRHL